MAGIDAIGTGMFLPLVVLFLTRSVGLSTVVVGVGLTVAGLAALLATPLIGHLGDRYDARPLSAAAYAGCALSFVLFTQVNSAWSFIVLASAIQVLDTSASSARRLVALSNTDTDDRVEWISYERTLRNLGYGIGGLCATAALAVGTRLGYDVVLLVNAMSYGCGAFLMTRMPNGFPAPTEDDSDHPRGSYRAVLRDYRYLAVAVASGSMWLNDAILRIGIPIWIVRRTAAPASLTGVLFSLNTLLVVACQMRLSRGTKELRGVSAAYRYSGLALVASCVMFGVSGELDLVAGTVALVVALTLLTLGETWLSAAQWGASLGMLRETMRARYLAVFAIPNNIQTAVGPLLITFALVHGGDWGWLGLGAIFAAAGHTGATVTRRAASSEQRATTVTPVSVPSHSR